MIREVYKVLDVKLDEFGPPMLAKNKGEMIRLFADAVNDSKTQFGAHPDDYALYFVGHDDSEKGDMTVAQKPLMIGFAKEFIVRKPLDVTPELRVELDKIGSALQVITSQVGSILMAFRSQPAPADLSTANVKKPGFWSRLVN